MAAITSITASGVLGAFTAAKTTLSADDTITIASGKTQLLILDNTPGGSLTCTIDGSGGTTVAVQGIGDVDVSGGYAIVVAAGAQKAVILSTISRYCQGTVHLLGASTLKATLIDI